MIIRKFRKALYDDFAGFAPWFNTFFDLFNQQSDMNTALQGNLTFLDNHRCAKKDVQLTHGIEKTVNSSLGSNIGLVMVGKSPQLLKPIFWRGAGLGSVTVKVEFDGAPSNPQDVTLYLFE